MNEICLTRPLNLREKLMNDKVLGRIRRTWVSAMSTAALIVALPALAQQAPLQLTVGEEAVADLSTFNYTGVAVSVTPSMGYLLCANTMWLQGSPVPTSVKLQPTNAGFEFGVVNAASNPITLNDVRSFRYGVGSVASVEVNKTAAPGTLGCYVTNSSGNRAKAFNGLFVEGFETPLASNCTSTSSDSCAAVRVASLSTDAFNNVVYTYFIDYHLPAGAANYTLRDGYNSTKFSQTTLWCSTLNQASTSCTGQSSFSRTVDVSIAGSAAAPTNGRIRVVRGGLAGVTIPNLQATPGPLVLAALFPEAPARSLEQNLGDNVSAGTATISDQAPVFNQIPGQFQANKITGMASTSFTISDDTIETAGMLLNATASVRFGTLGSFPALVNCGASTPIAGAPTRTCNVSFVPPSGYVNFATANRTSATADITIIATDSLNQSTTTSPISLVVTSTSNSTPVYTANPAPVGSGVNAVSTLTCLFSAPGPACAGMNNFLTGVAPGPFDAQDELELQTASILTVPGPQGANIACVGEGGADPATFFAGSFGSNPGPRILPSGIPGSYNLTYGLSGAAQPGQSVLCDVNIVDDGTPAPLLPASFKVRIAVAN